MIPKKRIFGPLIFLGSLLLIPILFWLIFLSPWDILTLKAALFLITAAILGIAAWIWSPTI